MKLLKAKIEGIPDKRKYVYSILLEMTFNSYYTSVVTQITHKTNMAQTTYISPI